MKFMVLTDLHQNTSALTWINRLIRERSPDAVLFLGDVTDMGTADDAAEIISSIEAKVLCIPGNCDPRDMPGRISDVATDMHGKNIEIGDCCIAGLGGSNITIFNTPFELTEEEIDARLRPISKKGMILMTHAPGYGILDHIPNGTSVGSKAIADIIAEFRPLVAVSGHIHEDIGAIRRDGTLFMNPGPARDGYCGFVTVEDGTASAELLGPYTS